MKNKIRIGNAGGFWGDDLGALKRQLLGGELDYVTIDYLAEITMSILRKQQLKNPSLGYINDFVEQIVEVAPILANKNTRIISNAGGINPLACAKQITNRLKPLGINLKIAVIEGDNILAEIDSLYPEKTYFTNMENGQEFAEVKNKIQSANVYLGIPPLLEALKTDAQIIIAGRVTDTSITMAPMVHEFNWALNDWDKLASGLIAGHIIECGAQASGGNFTDWEKVPFWLDFGYPIVEVCADGNFIVTKHKNTGGLITSQTIKEQLVYEMGNPAYYISPDVIANFLSIQLEDLGNDQVKVSGIKGLPSTHFLKVSMAYEDGYKAVSSIIISGENALNKAEIFDEIFWARLGVHFEKSNTEYVGFDSTHKHLSPENDPNEILLRFSVYDMDRDKIDTFSKGIAPMILSGPPGVAVTGGRPQIQNVMTYYPALIPKNEISAKVHYLNTEGNIIQTTEVQSISGFEQDTQEPEFGKQISNGLAMEQTGDFTTMMQLKELCLARSGDKGDMANIGLIARNKPVYDYLKQYFTADKVKFIFGDMCKGEVIRYELDNLLALNFLLEKSLDGGGTKSLMIDAQGKTYASALLAQKIRVPEYFITMNLI
jgi:hypothetical protein